MPKDLYQKKGSTHTKIKGGFAPPKGEIKMGEQKIKKVLETLKKEHLLNHIGEKLLKNWDHMPETRDGLDYAFLGQSQKNILNNLSTSSLVGADDELAIEEFIAEEEIILLYREFRKRNIMINKAGGTAGSGGMTYRISLPAPWVAEMGVTEDDKEVTISFDGEKIIIEK